MGRKRILPQDEKQQRRIEVFNAKLSEVIRALINAASISQTDLAERIHYTRSTLSTMLNNTNPSRVWNLEVLLDLSQVLGVSLGYIISMAEAKMEGKELELDLQTAGTVACSPERLDRIIRFVFPGETAELYAIFYCAQMLAITNPWFYDGYLSGKINDREAYTLLKEAKQNSNPEDDPTRGPWHTLRMYESKR